LLNLSVTASICDDEFFNLFCQSKKFQATSHRFGRIQSWIFSSGHVLTILDQFSVRNSNLYIVTTSGSTGIPKFVPISNASFFNLSKGLIHCCNLSSQSRVLQVASTTFDAHIFEYFVPLSIGATIILLHSSKHLDLCHIYETIHSLKVTHVLMVPSLAGALAETLQSENQWEKMNYLETLYLGGESVNANLLELLQKQLPKTKIMNMYGPAECTIVSTSKDFKSLSESSKDVKNIGRPLPNYKCFVVDDFDCPVPVGVTGQLLVGGLGVFDGYLNQPDLTSKVLACLPHICRGRLYRTGDLVKLLPNGELLFVGRADFQVCCAFLLFCEITFVFLYDCWCR
jgi:arthrofactin-type cyclic lipopeptide synthetase A